MENDFINDIISFLKNHNATNIVSYDVTEKSKLTNYLVLATTESESESRNLAEEMEKTFAEIKPVKEGEFPGDWIILDFGKVVVEIFNEKTRDKYNLEKLWGDSHSFVNTEETQEKQKEEKENSPENK